MLDGRNDGLWFMYGKRAASAWAMVAHLGRMGGGRGPLSRAEARQRRCPLCGDVAHSYLGRMGGGRGPLSRAEARQRRCPLCGDVAHSYRQGAYDHP
jgi:endogenous inhibitor of DNA gyrase (YacG/DUF329 family)